MLLHHFTAATTSHLGAILRDGEIRTTFGIHQDGTGPRVVWLTRNPNPSAQGWCSSDPIKTSALVCVEVEKAHPWPEYADHYDVDPEWSSGLAEAGGGTPSDWFVVESPIRRHAFEAIIFRPLLRKPREGDIDSVELELGDTVTYSGKDLTQLLRSRGRQRALPLLETEKLSRE